MTDGYSEEIMMQLTGQRVRLRDGVEYDTVRGVILRDGQDFTLRPKTQVLLEYLLQYPHRLISRQELMVAVWGHDKISDHSLHQAISELRKAIQCRHCIRTQPNRGYQWLPLENSSLNPSPRSGSKFFGNSWRRSPALFFSSLALTLAGALFGLQFNSSHQAQAQLNAQHLAAQPSPAMHALSMGLERYALGDYAAASEWYRQSLNYHPHWSAARLELARSQMALGATDTAMITATQAVSDARLNQDPYAEAAAMGLLSRLQWLAGDAQRSLLTVQQSADLANSHGHSCIVLESHHWQRYLATWIEHGSDDLAPRLLTQIPQKTQQCRRELARIDRLNAS